MRPLNRTIRGATRPTPGAAQAVAVGLAVAAFGLSYGVLAVAAGLSPWWAILSSVLVLGGGSQFAFIGVLAGGGNPMTGAIGGLLLNLRYVAFGLAVAPHLPRSGARRKALDAYLIVDESAALGLTAPPGQVARRFRLVGVTVFAAWVGATAVGAFGGQLIGDPETLGLDAAFPAGFLALLAPWLRERPGQVAAMVGTTLALALTPIAPPGIPIVAAGFGAVVAMMVTPASEHRDAGDTDASSPRRDVTTQGPSDATQATPSDATQATSSAATRQTPSVASVPARLPS